MRRSPRWRRRRVTATRRRHPAAIRSPDAPVTGQSRLPDRPVSGPTRPDTSVAGRRGPDRGASPVELAIVLPVILMLLFSSVQAAAWFIARATARNAAQEAVTAQRAYQAPAGVGAAQARDFLDRAGDWLSGWQSQPPVCTVSATEVSCTVSGRALRVVPGFTFTVQETAHGTVERFTPELP